MEVPTISERLFTYDYRNEKSGYLLEMVDQDTLDAVDATLKAAMITRIQMSSARKC